MNGDIYRRYLILFVKEAIRQSDGSNAGISAALQERYIPERGPKSWFMKNADEQIRALKDARKAFDEHRHWPRSLVLSHLGLDLEI